MAKDDKSGNGKSTELTIKKDQAPPAELLGLMEEHAGEGVSTKAEDRIIPLIYLLQANSPQVKPRDPKYVSGAKEGDIWLKNSVHQELVNGDDGFLFQPCFFTKVWNEWRPQRGGFVGRHEHRPADATETEIQTDSGEFRLAWVRPNGNIVAEHRLHVGRTEHGEQFVMSLTSTGHTTSREWMDAMNRFVLPSGKPWPSYARWWRVSTVNVSNNRGQSWAKFKMTDGGPVTLDDLKQGVMLFEAMAKGLKEVELPEDEAVHEDASAPAGTVGRKDDDDMKGDAIPF